MEQGNYRDAPPLMIKARLGLFKIYAPLRFYER